MNDVRRITRRNMLNDETADHAIQTEDDEVLEEIIALTVPGTGVPDVSETETTKICKITLEWLDELEVRDTEIGRANYKTVEAMSEAAISKARPIDDVEFLIYQLEVHDELHAMYERGDLKRNMTSLYLKLTAGQREQRLIELKQNP
jgi:hypothetical protein